MQRVGWGGLLEMLEQFRAEDLGVGHLFFCLSGCLCYLKRQVREPSIKALLEHGSVADPLRM